MFGSGCYGRLGNGTKDDISPQLAKQLDIPEKVHFLTIIYVPRRLRAQLWVLISHSFLRKMENFIHSDFQSMER